MSNARCIFLGLGNMGGALCKRLCKQGVAVLGLDIDATKTAALAKDFGVTPADSLEMALTHPEWKEAPVFICLPTYTFEKNLLFPAGKLMQGRVLLSMCSGDPDQARAFFSELKETCGVDTYVDGCHVGSPLLAAEGKGLVMVSCDRPRAELDSRPECRKVLDLAGQMGRLVYTGTTVGSSKALDFALVDMYMMNMLSFMSGLSMLEAEGVPAEIFLENMAIRMADMPGQFKDALPKMNSTEYDKNVGATISIWKNFFSGRLPYLQRHGLSTTWPDFALSVLNDPKVGGPAGEFDGHDSSRIQELLRFPTAPADPKDSKL